MEIKKPTRIKDLYTESNQIKSGYHGIQILMFEIQNWLKKEQAVGFLAGDKKAFVHIQTNPTWALCRLEIIIVL